MNLPKYYSNVCEEMPPEYSDYENFEVKFGYYYLIHMNLDRKRTMKLLKKLEEESTQKSMKGSMQITMRE